jgi:CDGSH-type Zn-finger protein
MTDDPAVITPYPDGPYLVRGDFVLRTVDGEAIEPGRATVALCRCGRSGVQPFCDGMHKVPGGDAACERVRRRPSE